MLEGRVLQLAYAAPQCPQGGLQAPVVLFQVGEPLGSLPEPQSQPEDEGEAHPAGPAPGLGLLPEILPGDALCQLLHLRRLGSRGGFCLRGSGLLNAQQLPHRHPEEPAQGDELFQLGQGGVTLPFGDGLPGHAHFFSQLLLG